MGDFGLNELQKQAMISKEASRKMAVLPLNLKNKALADIADALKERSSEIFEANKIDLDLAEKDGIAAPLYKRLKFDEGKLSDVVSGIESLIGLEDPVGKVLLHTTLDDGLELRRVTCAIGVIGVIFESRPDALVQIASLCLKSSNAVFLKGGSEALNTNIVLSDIMYEAGVKAGLPEGWLVLLKTREDVKSMLELDGYINLLIPRGSNAFVKYIMENTSIPVMGHADGVCHTYIDSDCDREMAIKVMLDAKTQCVSVCNATETILFDKNLGEDFEKEVRKALTDAGVEIFDEDAVEDWHHEYLDMKVSFKRVDGIGEAITHINRYGSGHTDAIITNNSEKAERFQNEVDSGSVLVNCSTRFADGFRYGFGAEVGISTSKLHARGPVGLEGLVTYKYKLTGNGDIVGDYAAKKKQFKHIHHKV